MLDPISITLFCGILYNLNLDETDNKHPVVSMIGGENAMQSQNDINSYTYTAAIFKRMPVGVALFDIHDFRLLAANTRYESFLEPEWQQGRAIGHSFIEWMPSWLPKEEAEYLLNIYRYVVETGTPYQTHERRVQVAGEEEKDSYWSWILDPIYDEQGQMVQLLLTENDVTSYVLAKQKAEQATRDVEAQRARLHTILDQLPEGVMLVEADGHISYTNCTAEYLLGVPTSRQVNEPLPRAPLAHSAMHLDGRPISPEDFLLSRALQGEDIISRETLIKRPNGSTIIVLTSTVPLRDEHGDITGAVSVFRDITARKNMEQQKNQFLSIASHELRTPITTLQGLAEILQWHVSQGRSLDNSRSLQAIDGIAEQSQHLTRLIGGMLDISRLENAELELELATHDLIAMLSKVVETQAITNKRYHIRLVLDGVQATDKLMMCVDEHHMVHVLNNLINNAVKYSSAGSEIEVGLRYSSESPEEVLMWVRDHGIGIASEELPHIFERFHRARNVDRSISGLGIGLYLVHQRVVLHGGRIWAESAEGVGSTFYVQLPLGSPQT